MNRQSGIWTFDLHQDHLYIVSHAAFQGNQNGNDIMNSTNTSSHNASLDPRTLTKIQKEIEKLNGCDIITGLEKVDFKAPKSVNQSIDYKSMSQKYLQKPNHIPYISHRASPNLHVGFKMKKKNIDPKIEAKINDFIALRNHGFFASDSLGAMKFPKESNYY